MSSIFPGFGFVYFLMLVISWNVRGLGRKDKRKVVKNFVLCHKPSFIFLQEMKLGFFDNTIVSSLGGGWLAV